MLVMLQMLVKVSRNLWVQNGKIKSLNGNYAEKGESSGFHYFKRLDEILDFFIKSISGF